MLNPETANKLGDWGNFLYKKREFSIQDIFRDWGNFLYKKREFSIQDIIQNSPNPERGVPTNLLLQAAAANKGQRNHGEDC